MVRSDWRGGAQQKSGQGLAPVWPSAPPSPLNPPKIGWPAQIIEVITARPCIRDFALYCLVMRRACARCDGFDLRFAAKKQRHLMGSGIATLARAVSVF